MLPDFEEKLIDFEIGQCFSEMTGLVVSPFANVCPIIAL